MLWPHFCIVLLHILGLICVGASSAAKPVPMNPLARVASSASSFRWSRTSYKRSRCMTFMIEIARCSESLSQNLTFNVFVGPSELELSVCSRSRRRLALVEDVHPYVKSIQKLCFNQCPRRTTAAKLHFLNLLELVTWPVCGSRYRHKTKEIKRLHCSKPTYTSLNYIGTDSYLWSLYSTSQQSVCTRLLLVHASMAAPHWSTSLEQFVSTAVPKLNKLHQHRPQTATNHVSTTFMRNKDVMGCPIPEKRNERKEGRQAPEPGTRRS